MVLRLNLSAMVAIISWGGGKKKAASLSASHFFHTQIMNPLERQDKTGTRTWLMEGLGDLFLILLRYKQEVLVVFSDPLDLSLEILFHNILFRIEPLCIPNRLLIAQTLCIMPGQKPFKWQSYSREFLVSGIKQSGHQKVSTKKGSLKDGKSARSSNLNVHIAGIYSFTALPGAGCERDQKHILDQSLLGQNTL